MVVLLGWWWIGWSLAVAGPAAPLQVDDLPGAWEQARDAHGVLDGAEAERLAVLAAGAGRAGEAAPRAASRGASPELVAFAALVAAVSEGRAPEPFLAAVPEGLVGRERWKAFSQLAGPPDQARVALVAALASEPADPLLATYCRRQDLRVRAASGTLAAAILAGDRAALEASRDPLAQAAMASVLLEEGRVEEALVAADNARRADPVIASTHTLFGLALSAAGLESAAVESLHLSARLAAWDPAPREALARLHWVRGEPWEAALGPQPRSNWLEAVAAELSCRSGRETEPAPGDHPRHLAAEGWCAITAGDLDGARDAFHAALGLNTRWVSAMQGLAEVHRLRGDQEGRVAHMRAAAATAPADSRLALALADVLAEQGRPVESLGVLTRLAHGRRMDPDLERRIRAASLAAGEPGAWLDSWARTTDLAPSAVRGAAFLSLVALLCAPLVLALGLSIRRPGRRWGLAEAFVAIGVALVGPILGLPLLLRLAPEGGVDTLVLALGATVIGEALAVTFAVALARRIDGGLGALGLSRCRWSYLGLALVLEAVVVVAGVLWSALLSGLDLSRPTQDVALAFDPSRGMTELLVAGTLAVIVAPLLEELLFRGLVQRAAVDRWGRWRGIALTACLFGAMHISEPAAVPPLLVLGLATGWLREASGSVWPAVCLHVVNNALAAVTFVAAAGVCVG